jgi:hypothetical protein
MSNFSLLTEIDKSNKVNIVLLRWLNRLVMCTSNDDGFLSFNGIWLVDPDDAVLAKFYDDMRKNDPTKKDLNDEEMRKIIKATKDPSIMAKLLSIGVVLPQTTGPSGERTDPDVLDKVVQIITDKQTDHKSLVYVKSMAHVVPCDTHARIRLLEKDMKLLIQWLINAVSIYISI